MSTPDRDTPAAVADPAEIALWRAADAVFDQLLELQPEARAAALQSMSLPPELEQRVQRLLRADSQAAEADACAGPISVPTQAALHGRQLGRWILQDELGRGGMAVVYRAHSAEPPHLQVALKLLPLASRAEGVERFRREQSILARLDHPNIAALIDAGTAEDGSLWLAMRLVDGEPIDRWCSARGLGLVARVRQVLQVCDAVAYAHRSLVVHRDIKPANVLVDASGHVHLLDFGIARLTEDDDDAEATATRWRALSPAYAAPEQFAGGPATTAMDVFGLGALLYALLCGRPPRAGAAAEAPITQPSRRRADIEPAEAQDRSLPPVQLLRGDLDAIVLKALDYDPARRYPSVDALAADLRRWLDGRAVQARAPTLRYRFSRALRRHWLPASLGLVATLALVVGSAIALERAAAAERERQAAVLARAEAEAGRARADALRGFLQGVFETQVPGRPREELPSTAMLLEEAENLALNAQGQPEVRADMLDSITQVWIARGDQTRGGRLVEASLALASDMTEAPALAAEIAARALLRRAQLQRLLRQPESALEVLTQAEQRLGTVAADELRAEIALERGHLLADQRLFEEAVAELQRLQGEPGAALPPRSRQRLLNALSLYHGQLGRHAEAHALSLEALALMRALYGPRHLRVAIMLANLGLRERALGRFDAAAERLAEALSIYDAVLDAPSEFRGSARLGVGWLALARGEFEPARIAFERGNAEIAQVRGLARAEDYDVYHWNRGIALAAGGATGDARAALNRALELLAQRPAPYAGMRAVAAAWLAIVECDAGSDGGPALRRMRAELDLQPTLAAEDRALTVEAEASCALAAGEPSRAADLLATQRAQDDVLAPGLVADVARRRARAATAAIALGQPQAAASLRREGLQALQAAGLAEHPLAAGLRAQPTNGDWDYR
jgi:tetratricopeptide (TPR) repeat protein